MSAIRNWKNFHWPGEPLDNFLRHEPHGEEVRATYVEGVSPRRKKKKLRVKARDAFEALRRT